MNTESFTTTVQIVRPSVYVPSARRGADVHLFRTSDQPQLVLRPVAVAHATDHRSHQLLADRYCGAPCQSPPVGGRRRGAWCVLPFMGGRVVVAVRHADSVLVGEPGDGGAGASGSSTSLVPADLGLRTTLVKR